MKRRITFFVVILLGISLFTGCQKEINQLSKPKSGDTVAEINVRYYGTIYVKFFEKEAPKAVENFVTHAKDGYYDGLSIYKIIENSLIESGDPTNKGSGGESIWGNEFKDEFNPYLQPYYGAMCMVNSGPDKNGSRFFIVQADKTYDDKVLDQIEQTYQVKFNKRARELYGNVGGAPWFYERNTVFGQVYKGFEVLDKIAKVSKSDVELGIPTEKVIIDKINIIKQK